eukprot:CAMPEP_0196131668 /NCGR_PEP_ID=MMETSP0910-20130528/1570_1 /TAXON_ID=49265 /ORGANISM="Thalassiosira rotula, Strain GSO102" /LENGTH=248 /DNA_ID=CAMNT_0041391153 /DNA_START=30 /DNA_END=776 /DNA_ORIENTATION=-
MTIKPDSLDDQTIMMSPINTIVYHQQQHRVSPIMYTPSSHFTAFTPVKQSRKRLRFQPSVMMKSIDCRMTQEEKSKSFYNRQEFNTFSLEAKAAYTASKEQSNKTPSSHDRDGDSAHHVTSQDCVVGLKADPTLRGLELYICPIRLQRKMFVQKALHKYYKKLNADHSKTYEEKQTCLAAASAKWSQWSKSVASVTAQLDSIRAYDDEDYCIPIYAPVDVVSIPAPAKRRRTISDGDGEQQQTKRRRY